MHFFIRFLINSLGPNPNRALLWKEQQKRVKEARSRSAEKSEKRTDKDRPSENFDENFVETDL